MNISCSYTCVAVGAQSAAALKARMAAVPVNLELPRIFGLRYVSDTTGISESTITRTMVFSGTPTTPATFSATLDPGNRGSPLYSVAVTAAGAGYGAAPTVAQSADDPPPLTRAILMPRMGVSDDVIVISGGDSGWTSATATFSGGGLAPGGTQATATVACNAGQVASLTVTEPGGPYTTYPDITVTGDGLGIVIASAGLKVIALDPITQGRGYSVAPTLTQVPVFATMFQNDDAKKSCLASFMTLALEKALSSEVTALIPVVS